MSWVSRKLKEAIITVGGAIPVAALPGVAQGATAGTHPDVAAIRSRFHPNQAGQVEYADLFNACIARNKSC